MSRIIAYEEKTQIASDDYLVVDSSTDGTRKIKASLLADDKKTWDEITGLKEDLNLLNYGKTTISGDLSYGIFENNFPKADPRKYNAVMMTAEKYDRDITITAKNGYNFLAYWYDDNDSYVGRTNYWGTSVTIPSNTPFRLWIRENPLDVSAVLNLNAVKYNIVFNTVQQDEIEKNVNDVDPTPTQGSSNVVSSGGVYDALHDLYSESFNDAIRHFLEIVLRKSIYTEDITTIIDYLIGAINGIDGVSKNGDTLIIRYSINDPSQQNDVLSFEK